LAKLQVESKRLWFTVQHVREAPACRKWLERFIRAVADRSETLVFQSYRSENVPAWLRTCMGSVKAWAQRRGYAYRLLGDELFDPLPASLNLLASPQRLPATDLARLLWYRDLLDKGWSRVVWMDADILVLDQEAFAVPDASHVLCRELWVWKQDGEMRGRWAVNNCVMAYGKGSEFLSLYIGACGEIAARDRRDMAHTALGPSFLTPLHDMAPLPLVDTVATLSPWMMQAVLASDLDIVHSFRELWDAPIYAVHLCRSLSSEEGGRMISHGYNLQETMVSLLNARLR